MHGWNDTMIRKLTKEQLDFMFNEHKEHEIKHCGATDMTKFQFLCNEVFDLWPYDSDIEDKWGRDLFCVMLCIKRRMCSEYWNVDDECYNTYLIVCQLLDKKGWINWGTSIRYAWFEFDEDNSPHKLFPTITQVSIDDKHYDEEGIEWNEENLNTLLEWMLD